MNEGSNLVFQEIKDRLKDQLLAIDQIATKFNFLLAFNSIIIASFIQGLLSVEQKDGINYLFVISIFLLLLSVAVDLRGLILQKYRRDPDPKKLYEKYIGKNVLDVEKVLIHNYIESFDFNTKKLHKINKYFFISIFLSSSALLFIFLFLIRNNVNLLWEMMKRTICQI